MRNIETKEDLEEAIEYVERHSLEASVRIEQLIMLCIRKAQEFKDIDLEFRARMESVNVLNNRHKPGEAIAIFPWLLKKCDEDRNRFDYDELLWAYKWIVSYSKQFASIPKARLVEIWDDFEKRMREAGSGEKIIHAKKFYFHAEMGETALAEAQLQLHAAATTSGRFDGCRQCEKHMMACFLMDRGRYEALLETVTPVIRGEIKCHLSERYNLHMGMIANMMLGNWEEAEHLAQRSLRHLDYNIAILFPFSSHLVYYGITEQFTKGRKIVEKQLPYIFQNAPDLPKYEFLVGALVFFQRLKASDTKTIQLALPDNKLFYEVSGIYEVGQCISYINEQTETIASALDKRNENDYYVQHTEEILNRYAAVHKPFTTIDL